MKEVLGRGIRGEETFSKDLFEVVKGRIVRGNERQKMSVLGEVRGVRVVEAVG